MVQDDRDDGLSINTFVKLTELGVQRSLVAPSEPELTLSTGYNLSNERDRVRTLLADRFTLALAYGTLELFGVHVATGLELSLVFGDLSQYLLVCVTLPESPF